jgi:putative transposase
MAQQARKVSMSFGEQRDQPTHLIRDLDNKFTRQFDAILEADEIEVVRVGPRAPNLHAFAERYVLSIKSECLDHFIVFGEDHLRHIVGDYDRNYNEHRPHQGIGNIPIVGGPEPPKQETSAVREVLCQERLGGLLKHYHHAALNCPVAVAPWRTGCAPHSHMVSYAILFNSLLR